MSNIIVAVVGCAKQHTNWSAFLHHIKCSLFSRVSLNLSAKYIYFQEEEEPNLPMDQETVQEVNKDGQRRLRVHAEGLLSSAHVKRWERMTADFAKNIKKKTNVLNKAADLLASNWCNHMVAVVDELYGFTDQRRNELNLIIKSASTNRHRQLCRIPIFYRSVKHTQGLPTVFKIARYYYSIGLF